VRSAGPSRPVSQISTSASSAMSGATLARALMANSFMLSDPRTSRYRSGFSTLTRADSATLPNGDYPSLNSPWRDRFSISDSLLSPRSAPLPPVPPVPQNAERVYSPPLISRGSLEPAKRHLYSGIPQQEHEDEPAVESLPPTSLDNTYVPSSRQISSMTEMASSTSSTNHERPQAMPGKKGTEIGPECSISNLTAEPETHPHRRFRESVVLGAEDLAPPLITETSPSSKDIDNVIDYYSFGVTPEPTSGVFRLPFSPITEESSSQLSPPVNYRPDTPSSSGHAVSTDGFLQESDPSLTGGETFQFNQFSQC